MELMGWVVGVNCFGLEWRVVWLIDNGIVWDCLGWIVCWNEGVEDEENIEKIRSENRLRKFKGLILEL